MIRTVISFIRLFSSTEVDFHLLHIIKIYLSTYIQLFIRSTAFNPLFYLLIKKKKMKFIILPAAVTALLAATLGLSSPIRNFKPTPREPPPGPRLTMTDPNSKVDTAYVIFFDADDWTHPVNVKVDAVEAAKVPGGRFKEAQFKEVVNGGINQEVKNYECYAYEDEGGYSKIGNPIKHERVALGGMMVKAVRCAKILDKSGNKRCGYTCINNVWSRTMHELIKDRKTTKSKWLGDGWNKN